MRSDFQTFDFPKQRIPTAEKDMVWVANSTDWIIAQGISMKDTETLDAQYNFIQEIIDPEMFRKTLNPYNATEEKYQRMPATMRHYDMVKGIIRRYVSEYLRNPHDFIVGANNAEVVFAKSAKLREEINKLVEQQIAVKIQESYTQWVNQGQDPKEFKPEQAVDINAFTKEFEENYIDDISAQGQAIFNIIKDLTEDDLLYVRAYFDFVSFGECFTYTDIVGTEIIKEHVIARDAYPVRSDNFFVENDDGFARRRKRTYQQIMDEFGSKLQEPDIAFLDTYYARNSTATKAELMTSVYESYFPEVCGKYTEQERKLFKDQPIMSRDNNSGLYDVWHVVWRGEQRFALVTFVNEASLIDTRIEADDYVLNTEAGDISIEYEYRPQVFESTRIGGRNNGIYPYGARAIAFNRNGKLPYNGVTELLPGLGKFSIVSIVAPYSIFYDIVAFHREMALARNKLSILMIARSLLGAVAEDTIHKMIADGVLYFDDTNDQGMLRAQQVRMLQASNIEIIGQLGQLLQEIDQAAKNQVDMTPQRYGEIANSAGKGTTDEAIMRGSMGSVIIEFIMDSMRERDYARDMDYSKFAWIDGLDTSYRDEGGNTKYISLDIDKHNYASYLIKAKSSVNEKEKLNQYRQLAFSAAQNGDMDVAAAAIEGDNVATITKLIKKFNQDKQAYETNLKQIEQQTEQLRQEFELKKIAAQGQEDRQTEELKGAIDAQIQLIKADANMISFDNGVSDQDKQQGMERLEGYRSNVEREKIKAGKQSAVLDSFNKYEDRKVKREDIQAKIKIAQTNKNQYDFKKKKKS